MSEDDPHSPVAPPPANPKFTAFNEEMRRTAFQKKAVTRLPVDEVIDIAVAFFTDRGYRAGRTGRPNQMFVMGGKEGILPRVTGEIKLQANVGKAKTTMVTLDAVGERLGTTMGEFLQELRSRRTPTSPSTPVNDADPPASTS